MVMRNLERAKVEILELFEYQSPPDLMAYSTVNSSGIIASVITSLVNGDCDLPLPLSPENAYLSSIFSTSDARASNSVVHMDFGKLYQEYTLKLVRWSL